MHKFSCQVLLTHLIYVSFAAAVASTGSYGCAADNVIAAPHRPRPDTSESGSAGEQTLNQRDSVHGSLGHDSLANVHVELKQLLERRRSSRELLDFIMRLDSEGRLSQLGSDQIAFSNWSQSGWRRELVDCRGQRIVLAGEGPLLIAICEQNTIELSIADLSHGTAGRRGYAGTPQYFGHRTSGIVHITAMSAGHLARQSTELSQYYYYFAGPSRELLGTAALPPPPIVLHW